MQNFKLFTLTNTFFLIWYKFPSPHKSSTIRSTNLVLNFASFRKLWMQKCNSIKQACRAKPIVIYDTDHIVKMPLPCAILPHDQQEFPLHQDGESSAWSYDQSGCYWWPVNSSKFTSSETTTVCALPSKLILQLKICSYYNFCITIFFFFF